MSAALIEERSQAITDLVGLEAAASERKISTYSKGMLQRIGIARALCATPNYFYLDEPTAGIDPKGVEEFGELIDTLKTPRQNHHLVLPLPPASPENERPFSLPPLRQSHRLLLNERG